MNSSSASSEEWNFLCCRGEGDLYGKCEVKDPDPDQCWQDWPIRLYKCAKSLKLFGFEEEFNSVKEYALPLIKAGLNFQYGSRDCAAIFLR